MSLWWILEKFGASLSFGLFAHFGGIIERSRKAAVDEPGSVVPQEILDTEIEGVLESAAYISGGAGLTESAALAKRLIKEFKDSTRPRYGQSNPVTSSHLQWRLKSLRDLMESEAQKRLFLSVPFHLHDYYLNPKPMGKNVYDAFPSARLDLEESGSCLACGRNNGAMNHLMLSAEVALRELGRDRQVSSAKSGDIEFKQWGQIIKELGDAVVAIQQWPNSVVKDDAHRFYNSALCEIRAFNDGWRRHLAHARAHTFADEEALALWHHVERFLIGLSGKISEGSYTPLIWT